MRHLLASAVKENVILLQQKVRDYLLRFASSSEIQMSLKYQKKWE